jgi:hypothetical protein
MHENMKEMVAIGMKSETKNNLKCKSMPCENLTPHPKGKFKIRFNGMMK